MERERKEHKTWFQPVEELSKGHKLSYVVPTTDKIAIQERDAGVG